jgi:hypothetical protein
MRRIPHGLISTFLFFLAIGIALDAIFAQPNARAHVLGAVYIGIVLVSLVNIVMSFCMKCPCRLANCSRIFPGKLTAFMPGRKDGPRSPVDILSTVISLAAIVLIPQLWLVHDSISLVLFWAVLAMSGLETAFLMRPAHAGKYLSPGFFKNGNTSRVLGRVYLGFLYVLGIVHWTWFLNFGRLTFNLLDWLLQGDYFAILKAALKTGSIPYHTSAAIHETNRFLANPETIISPQIFLLRFMDIGPFVLVNVLLLYTIGFAGSLLIKKKYDLALLPFTVFFLLFNFCGHITSHLAVGHIMWNGYFLLPLFFLYFMDLPEKKATFDTALKLSIVLFAMMLQGAFHLCIWCVMFIVLYMLFNLRDFKWGMAAIVMSGVLSSFRIFPALTTFDSRTIMFLSGYPSVKEMAASLISIKSASYPLLGGLGWWEYDQYIGVEGLFFVVLFAFIFRKAHEYKSLDAPLFFMAFLSLSVSWVAVVKGLGFLVPMVQTERVSSRFLILPLVQLIVISAVNLNKNLEYLARKPILKILLVFLTGLMVAFLFRHSRLWSLSVLDHFTAGITNSHPSIAVLKNDAVYVRIVNLSAIVSLASSLAAVILLYRKNIKKVLAGFARAPFPGKLHA